MIAILLSIHLAAVAPSLPYGARCHDSSQSLGTNIPTHIGDVANDANVILSIRQLVWVADEPKARTIGYIYGLGNGEKWFSTIPTHLTDREVSIIKRLLLGDRVTDKTASQEIETPIRSGGGTTLFKLTTKGERSMTGLQIDPCVSWPKGSRPIE